MTTTSLPRSRQERDRLVEQYLPLVRHVVSRLQVTMPATLSRDDFFSVGVMGLMHAAAAYDPGRGASFKTFAFTAIRGAVLDEIRKHDPVPRSRRDRIRQIDKSVVHLRAELGRAPTIEELAERMEVSANHLDDDLLALHTCRTLSLDDGSFGNGDDDAGLGNILVDERNVDPSDAVATHEMTSRLARAISELPEVERNVVVLYHYEHLYLKEIGEIIGVTESRVSQVLSRALERLRMKLKDKS